MLSNSEQSWKLVYIKQARAGSARRVCVLEDLRWADKGAGSSAPHRQRGPNHEADPPPNAKISKEAKETMQECVSEFISFVTGEASDKCHKEKRKTVNGDDICWAFGSLGFDEYAQSLKRYLSKYREAEGEKANQNRAHYSGHEEIRIDDSSNGRAAPVAVRAQGVSPAPFSYNNLMENRTIN
ncbi:UNVERIFIED_CONTAM: Nuclear transcription factor Y subunit B-5 [Sesamum calycinum]|uniref:Nuclear transcription factor Y subunit B-5 n=1 Tax=Sesamum calycinum TaxID=2727403 RepID=A0AAW2SEW0_9LAMI